jgi:hypothetical protein
LDFRQDHRFSISGAFVEYEIAIAGKVFKDRVANPKGKGLYRSNNGVKLNFAAENAVVAPKGIE